MRYHFIPTKMAKFNNKNTRKITREPSVTACGNVKFGKEFGSFLKLVTI